MTQKDKVVRELKKNTWLTIEQIAKRTNLPKTSVSALVWKIKMDYNVVKKHKIGKEYQYKIKGKYIPNTDEKKHLVNIKEIQDSIKSLRLEEAKMEKLLIMKAILKFDGRMAKVSNVLGLSRSSLYRKLDNYNINKDLVK